MTTRRDALRLMGAATLAAGPLARAAAPAGQAAGATGSTSATSTAGTRPWQVVTTAKDAQRRLVASSLAAPVAATQPVETDISVFVDTGKRYQAIFGFGGAVTDATADLYAKLKPAAKKAFITACFDPRQGLGYNIMRTTINSSDFGTDTYSYVRDGDTSLASFDIAHDLKHRIPLLREGIAAAKVHSSEMRVIATPWSAPAWMKSNKTMLKGGTLLPEYRAVWANYFVKFIQAYEKAGVPIWGVSPQNEPMATQTWESMLYTAEDETRFLGDHLGPTLKAAGMGGKKILVWDHNRDLLPQRARHVLEDPKARPYVWGVAYHWYETWAGGEPMHRNVAAVHEAYPDVPLLMTEGCIEKYDATRLQDWANGERYGSQMIADLNAGSSGWVDWNMLLDMQGGPNHVKNYCFAPLHASDDGELVFTPIFHYIAHVSRYIKPQARRVGAATSRSVLDATAFRNPDGGLAILVLNKTDKPQKYRLFVDKVETTVEIPARAIQTVLA
ncbi:glycoside hydrolase family 30 protein [uncultured Massilia sp.]|uniref:glycoside hydrolase family 30 protein n=1 Tax=uncultured Massilia sp. TaxID=169973 RepID=UPI0025CF4C23|nr:glycoside hydrolase family 30 protein [uncultured Massilia sp.]